MATVNSLQKLKKLGKKAFIPYLVVGDPDLATSAAWVDALIEEGADLIELGVPFSDALADGPVIQTASERASKTTSLLDVLHFAKQQSITHPNFPFLLFTYYNPVLKMGIETFAQEAQSAKIQYILIVDLPPEEAANYLEIMNRHSILTVFLASPTTTPARLALVCKSSTGFIYSVSRTGVTGTQVEVSTSLAGELELIKRQTDQPIAVGFGISNGEQAKQVALLADAVVVGSAFVKLKSVSEVRKLAKEIRASLL